MISISHPQPDYSTAYNTHYPELFEYIYRCTRTTLLSELNLPNMEYSLNNNITYISLRPSTIQNRCDSPIAYNIHVKSNTGAKRLPWIMLTLRGRCTYIMIVS